MEQPSVEITNVLANIEDLSMEQAECRGFTTHVTNLAVESQNSRVA